MSLPKSRADLVGNHITRSELTIASSLVGNATDTSIDVVTDKPKTMVLLASVASGEMTVKVSVHSGTADFGSPDKTVVIADTKVYALVFDTTSSKLEFGVNIEETASTPANVTTIKMAVLSLDKLSEYEGWGDIGSGCNATASNSVGNGSGTFTVLA